MNECWKNLPVDIVQRYILPNLILCDFCDTYFTFMEYNYRCPLCTKGSCNRCFYLYAINSLHKFQSRYPLYLTSHNHTIRDYTCKQCFIKRISPNHK